LWRQRPLSALPLAANKAEKLCRLPLCLFEIIDNYMKNKEK